MVQIRTKWCDNLAEHRSRTRSGNGKPTPSLGQADRHGHKAGSSTRTRTPPGGRGISASAQLPHTAEAEGGPVSAPTNHATRLRGLGRPQRSWAGAGRHWGRQRAIGVGKLPTPIVGFLPRCESPTPMRVSCPDTARRTRKGPAAGNRSVERTPRTPPPPKGDAPVEGGARRTPRTRAHSPGPLGISARSAASRSGTS